MTLIGRLRGNFSLRIRSPRPNSNSSIRTKHTGSLSTSGGGSLAVIPEVELDSASTSDIVSFEGDDAFSTDALRSLDPNDPYADVRYDLDRLFYNNDRKLHSSSSASSTASGGEDDEAEPPVPWFIAYTCYLGYMVFFVVGNLRDVCALLFGGRFRPPKARYPSEDPTRYATLLMSWEHFFACRIYCRLQDCFNRPIASNPGTTIQVLERLSRDGQKSMEVVCRRSSTASDDGDSYQRNPHCTATPDGTLWRECLNLGSYNYLGFADDWQDTCAIDVRNALTTYPISMSASLGDCGRTHLHRRVEAQIATFLGKDDALCLNMGFNTNATVLPALVGKGDLVVSDALNHNSLVNGARASGAAVRVFRHNDTTQLEAILREAILLGRPRLRRPWNKILVVVEGIYSMEGEYCDLKNIVRLCKQYGAYVYLDEAHSIGATGPTGRGCAEHAGVDPADIDVMMGTFTKSFGALGGYIAASKETIAFLRRRCSASVHHNSMSPIVCQQVLSALQVITGEDGTDRGSQKLRALRDNSAYFRMRLKEMGLIVLGPPDSPVVPVMIYNMSKIAAFSRECFKRGLAVVVVGFPAVPILLARARFCVSAGHTRADLDRALRQIDEVVDIVGIRYGTRLQRRLRDTTIRPSSPKEATDRRQQLETY